MKMFRRAARACCLSSVLVVAAGCSGGPQMASVNGTVTLDGEPARGVIVVFQPENYPPSMAFTDTAGQFELRYNSTLSGAPLGKHQVRIVSANGWGDGDPSSDPQFKKLMGTSRPTNIPARVAKKFSETVEVKAGNNRFEFVLKTGN